MLWLCLSEGAYSKPLAVLPSTLSQKICLRAPLAP